MTIMTKNIDLIAVGTEYALFAPSEDTVEVRRLADGKTLTTFEGEEAQDIRASIDFAQSAQFSGAPLSHVVDTMALSAVA